MLDRRQFLGSTAAAAVLSAAAARGAPTAEAGKLNALFDTFFQDGLRQNPEGATQLGLDTGKNADLRSRLRDNSAAGIAAAKALNARELASLRALDPAKLTGLDRVNYDTVLYTREST